MYQGPLEARVATYTGDLAELCKQYSEGFTPVQTALNLEILGLDIQRNEYTYELKISRSPAHVDDNLIITVYPLSDTYQPSAPRHIMNEFVQKTGLKVKPATEKIINLQRQCLDDNAPLKLPISSN
ncbi:hypothetical protein C4573_02450 [Candidatus Woesearchaeota archaeon]|nr:MAG: hypothetical protein C4573_02450 [Candidatus Woesearchaeota archaeon]